MNVSRLRRITSRRTVGRVLTSGLLLAAIATGAVAAGPAAFASRSSALARSAQSASGLVVTWSESPASATAPDTRSKFSYTNIQPGSTVTDHVAILNRSPQSVAFSVYATDASGTTLGNVLELLPGGVRPHDIGSWVRFIGGVSQLSIVIGAHKGIIEPFTLVVPRQASPGDHTGGMMAAVSIPRRTSKGSEVLETQRIAVPIEMRVTGKLTYGLQVESISTGFHSPLSPFATGSATVSYTVHNTGNVRLSGSQVVSVTGPLGVSSTLKLKNLPTVLPGDSVRVTSQERGLFPAGPMSAKVHVTPQIPPGEPQPVSLAGSVTGTASLFGVPWSLLVFIVLLIGLAVGGWRGLGWRRRNLSDKLAVVADAARRETERRLLGDKGAPAATDPSASGPQRPA
jgi:hypothetical protein